MPDTPEFTAEHREVLDFEKQWWKHQGNKTAQVQAKLKMSAARYYRVLGAAIDHPEALTYDPMLVKRLRRLREVRKTQRRSRREETSSTRETPQADQPS